MTQVLDAPTNGNELANAPQQQIAQRAAENRAVEPKSPVNPLFGDRGIEIQNFDDLWKLSCVIARSPFAPKGMDQAETIFVAIQLGLEVGMTPMASMQSIAVINGRPGIYGDAALALVRGSGICNYYLEFESDNAVHALARAFAVALEFNDADKIRDIRQRIAEASLNIKTDGVDFGYTAISMRKGAPASVVSRFTVEDAKKAGLWGKQGPWTQYWRRMLMWRCRGFNLRDNFGDVLKGMYTAEEAGDMPATLPGPAAMVAAASPLNVRVQRAREAQNKALTDQAQVTSHSAPSAPSSGPASPEGSGDQGADAGESQIESDLAGESNQEPVAPGNDNQMIDEGEPRTFNRTQIINWIVRDKPEQMNVVAAEKFAKVVAPRDWDKIDMDARDIYLARWKKQGFGWPQPAPAAE